MATEQPKDLIELSLHCGRCPGISWSLKRLNFFLKKHNLSWIVLKLFIFICQNIGQHALTPN